jgi:hypothetical protein
MLKRARAAAMLAACLFAQPVTAAPPLMLEAAGPWTYSDAGGMCVAERSFGTGEQAVGLAIKKFGPGRLFILQAAGHPLRLRKRAPISLRFQPDQVSHVHPDAWFGVNAAGRATFMVTESFANTQERRRRSSEHLTPDFPPSGPFPFWISEEKREAEIEALAFSGPLFTPVTLRTGPMLEPMAALRHCLEKQFQAWGLDLAVQASIVRAAEPIPGRWLTTNDYPTTTLLYRKSSIVRLRLLVNRQGMPTDCHVVDAAPPEEFNRLTCSLVLQRARFKPALGPGGVPVDSAYFITVNWVA